MSSRIAATPVKDLGWNDCQPILNIKEKGNSELLLMQQKHPHLFHNCLLVEKIRMISIHLDNIPLGIATFQILDLLASRC